MRCDTTDMYDIPTVKEEEKAYIHIAGLGGNTIVVFKSFLKHYWSSPTTGNHMVPGVEQLTYEAKEKKTLWLE